MTDNIKEALKGMTGEERKRLLEDLKNEEKQAARERRDAYEALRAAFMLDVKNKLLPVVEDVRGSVTGWRRNAPASVTS